MALAVTPARYRSWTRAALWALTIIVFSGAAVRLTGSGLGCSDWPKCEEDQFVADFEYHNLIEFGNRLFTGVVAIAVMLAVLGSLGRVPRRADLTRWSWGLVAGVIAQIVLGGLLVRTELDPRFTMGHFLLSMVLIWNAVVLQHRAAWPDVVAADDTRAEPAPAAPLDSAGRPLLGLLRAVTAVSAVLLVTGTVVTGSGPHSGSDEPEVAARLPFDLREVTRIHSLVAITLVLIVAALLWQAHRSGRLDVRQRAATVFGLLVVQGTVGYLQYFNGVPELLVMVHIVLATFTWISVVRLHLTLRQPAQMAPAADPPVREPVR